MNQNKNDVALGRFLSLILRHSPSSAGIVLDDNGWADVKELLSGVNRTGRKIDIESLERIVRENSKNRYSFNEDKSKIRANQGHSVEVDVELPEMRPPDVLYHGTATRFLQSIKESGITKQNRQHVHLSADVDTAIAVGKRHGKPMVLYINTAEMFADGHKFMLSENGVWLCDDTEWHYVGVLTEHKI